MSCCIVGGALYIYTYDNKAVRSCLRAGDNTNMCMLQELLVISEQQSGSVDVRVECPQPVDIDKELKETREEYEALMVKNTQEVEKWFQTKVREESNTNSDDKRRQCHGIYCVYVQWCKVTKYIQSSRFLSMICTSIYIVCYFVLLPCFNSEVNVFVLKC